MKMKAKTRILAFEDEWISDDKELLNLYQTSKIVVCPARKEGLGMVALEGRSHSTAHHHDPDIQIGLSERAGDS